jgi:hypothetical protein
MFEDNLKKVIEMKKTNLGLGGLPSSKNPLSRILLSSPTTNFKTRSSGKRRPLSMCSLIVLLSA